MNKKNKRGVLEFSFAWIFAIVAGAFILFLAIFSIYKFSSIAQTNQDTQTAKDIGILLNPLESSFETTTKNLISTQLETRIYCGCSLNGYFGKQTIKVSEKTYNKWSETDKDIALENKYIFSKNYVEGKEFYVYSKKFDFPFKVADLLYLTSSKDIYCFINAPERINDEITALQSTNLLIENCPEESVKVCFRGSQNCNVIVNDKSVRKSGNTVYYEGDSLMYAAIFSDKALYECQLNRLMERVEQISLIYKGKSLLVRKTTGCETTEITSNLIILSNSARNFKNSLELSNIANIAEIIQTKNENMECRLW